MGEENNTDSRVDPNPRRDGNIDFTRYATHQLEELRDSLDATASPLNHAALLAELLRRAPGGPQTPRWTGRFTRLSGLAGWVTAKLRRAPLYGEGALEFHPDHLVLQGWQRTWLGFGIERALHVPLQRVRNAIITSAGLRFQIRRRGWFAANVEFLPTAAADREQIVRTLPPDRTVSFDRYGASLLEFEDQLRSRCRVAWLTPLVVLLNVMAFCALWIQAGSLLRIPEAPLTLLGANVGPLTLEGQWWRLLSATFVHANLWHLFLNMWALWNIGRLSERLYGRWVLLFLYLGGGIFASLSSLMWDPARSSVGASGAIFALFGVFLAYLLRHRRQVPRGIFTSHWIPTLLFVGFNLYTGATTPGVDNAAHVGGLLSGFAFGLLAARAGPRAPAASPLRWATAFVLYVLLAGSALSFVLWTRGPTPLGQQFAARHTWYISGEAKALTAWQQLAGAATAGTITDEDLSVRIGKEVLPFWRDAASRLQAEVPTLSGEEKRYVQAVSDFARLRKEWAEAVVAATFRSDQKMLEVAQARDAEAMAEVARVGWLAARSNAARMTGGLVNLTLMQRLRSRLMPREGDCVEVPPALETGIPVDADDLPTDSPQLARSLGCEAQELFLGGDFEALDARLSKAAARVADLPAGSSTLSALYGGLSDLIYYSEGRDIEQYLRHLSMWRRSVPDSYYPDLFEVELYHLWAWTARGHGTANKITPQVWALFSQRNQIAKAALDESEAAAGDDPLWCHLALQLQHDLAHELKPIEDTFHTCIGRFPEYMSLYTAMLRSLMPRWYGSSRQVADFIDRSSASAPEERRDAMYAHLYWIYANLEIDDVNIFVDSSADWSRVHQGMEDLEQRYPDSDLVLNGHARLACLASDKDTYRSLRRRLSGRFSASAWTKKTMRWDCDRRL